MIDYQSHVAALRVLESKLEEVAASTNDPHLGPVRKALRDQPSYAALGSIIDHLFEHVSDCDHEITLLTEATQVWRDITQYIAQVASMRTDLENLVLNPSQPNAFEKFNNVAEQLQNDLLPKFAPLTARLQAYFDELKPLQHVTQHGQAQDKPVTQWSWRDIILSRRTAAFVENLSALARDDGSEEALSFAYGAIASYVGNATGSAYLNQTVGGPRRAHPIRDRLASYTMGAWLRQNSPNLTPSIDELRVSLTFGSPTSPALPPKIAQLLSKAIDQTYGAHLGPQPDLGEAYKKLLQHLKLLEAFPMPPLPQFIDSTLWTRLVPLNPQDPNSGGPPLTPLDPPPSQGSSSSDIPWWEWVLFAVCIALVIACYFLGPCSPEDKQPIRGPFSHPNDPNDPNQPQAYLASNDALIGVNIMFNLHVALYTMALYAVKTIKLLGMLYPEAIDMSEPQYSQFTAIPSAPFTAFRRPIADPNRFLISPSSAPENPPATTIAPFTAGASPISFLFGPPGLGVDTYGLNLWLAEAGANGDPELTRINRNLDADRGFHHLCWQLQGLTSIITDPLTVQLLSYNDI